MIRLCFILIVIFFTTVLAQRRPIVTTLNGQLRGIRETSGLFHTFYSFKGVPYAKPPVGDLRFRNPVKHDGWQTSGVRDAARHRSHCPNDGIDGIGAGGDEDCLFLNVYTPDLKGNLSVMFWIHGGAFVIGDGNSLVYGPDLLVRENVVVVTINYRLSSLGFLSTSDEHAQGNYALKDIVMALKWVKDNIASFGGSSEKITVFGQSAGSTAIHLLLLSKMANGLFHQAIMQSGTGVSPFAFQTNPREHAEEIGRKIGLEFNSTESLMKQLRKVDYRKILNVERGLFNMDKPLGLRAFDFAPSLEPENSLEERFLTNNPTELMINGSSLNVPLIIGTTSNEGLLMVREYLLDEEVFDRYNNDDNFFVPLSFNLDESSSEIKEIADAFRNLYFDGQNLSSNSLNEWAKFHTDAQFKFPADRAIKSFALNTTEAIYYYDFSFDGGLNFLKTLLFLRSFQGACHADDIFYLFSPAFPIPVWPTDHSLTVRRRLIRLWANFAKTGNPTPETDELVNKLWPRYSLENEEYLDIGHDLLVKNNQGRLKTWHDFQKQFTGHL